MDAYLFHHELCCEACADQAKAWISSASPSALQALAPEGGEVGILVHNLIPQGNAIARIADDLVDASVEAIGGGFQDGGCLAFAESLREWSDGTVVPCAVVSIANPDVVQHVVGRIGTLYIDSDGIGNAVDMVAKMDRYEGPHRGMRFVLSERPLAECDLGDIPADAALSRRVATSLRERLPFDRKTFETLARPVFDPDDDRTFDSTTYPQGPFADGGGEADAPAHCSKCAVFLENPLTQAGVAFVIRHVNEGLDPPERLAEWRSFYGVLFDNDMDDNDFDDDGPDNAPPF